MWWSNTCMIYLFYHTRVFFLMVFEWRFFLFKKATLPHSSDSLLFFIIRALLFIIAKNIETLNLDSNYSVPLALSSTHKIYIFIHFISSYIAIHFIITNLCDHLNCLHNSNWHNVTYYFLLLKLKLY